MTNNPHISAADHNDIPHLVALVNSAYRGDGSKEGWTTESHLLKGPARTDEAAVSELILGPGAVMLKYVDEDNVIQGCVYLQKRGARLYLGMLSVSPLIQAKGIGKKLLAAAIEFAREQGCRSIYMTVISIRHELIAWYERHGYKPTGATEPFPYDPRFGEPMIPLEMVVLEKTLPDE